MGLSSRIHPTRLKCEDRSVMRNGAHGRARRSCAPCARDGTEPDTPACTVCWGTGSSTLAANSPKVSAHPGSRPQKGCSLVAYHSRRVRSRSARRTRRCALVRSENEQYRRRSAPPPPAIVITGRCKDVEVLLYAFSVPLLGAEHASRVHAAREAPASTNERTVCPLSFRGGPESVYECSLPSPSSRSCTWSWSVKASRGSYGLELR